MSIFFIKKSIHIDKNNWKKKHKEVYNNTNNFKIFKWNLVLFRKSIFRVITEFPVKLCVKDLRILVSEAIGIGGKEMV